MKLALCQLNPTVGAVRSNAQRLLEFAREAHLRGAELMFSPELSLCGYPPQDLLFNKDFLRSCETELKYLANEVPIPIIAGAPGQGGFNAAFYCFVGEMRLIARKRLLPNYQVFDEQRYFKPGPSEILNGFDFVGKRFGVSICEDAWNDFLGLYPENPIRDLVQQGADMIVNLTASPFEMDKVEEREQMFVDLAQRYGKPVLVVGQVGANDSLIFDGGSLVLDPKGRVLARGRDFEEELILCTV